MAIIPQRQLFSWKEIEDPGDLQRLQLVLKYLPDEPLMRLLESDRGKGRSDYPIRAVWNSILAGIEQIFDDLVEQVRKELPGFGTNLAMDPEVLRDQHSCPAKERFAGYVC